jgi:ABC-2 type transport system permease protein
MNWKPIARKDFLDSVRSRTLWALVVVFVAILGLIAYGAQTIDGAGLTQFIDFTATGFTLFVPLVAIVLGYKAIVDERESGTIAIALSFPHDRRDMVVGKFLGRSAVLAIPILVGLLVASVLVVVLYDSFPVLEYLLFAVLNVVLGLAFLAMAVGLSMSTTSSRRVTAGAFGAYILLAVLWSEIINVFVVVLWRFQPDALVNPPDWVPFLRLSSPVESYNRLVAALFDSFVGSQFTGPDAPWVVDWWVAVLLLVGWVVVPLGVGYLQFQRVDL